jgi:hypothetical protein
MLFLPDRDFHLLGSDQSAMHRELTPLKPVVSFPDESRISSKSTVHFPVLP